MKLKTRLSKKARNKARRHGGGLPRIDPTRTITLRAAFAAEINRYFVFLRRELMELLGKEDALGVTANVYCPTGPGGGIDPTCSPSPKEPISEQYRRISKNELVDGRVVREGVPNQSSIDATVDEPNILPGIREVPMAEFSGLSGKSYSAEETKRIKALAEQIRLSGEISPLIVVDDGNPEGPYILEGGHRAEALFILKAKSFPAMVVQDLGGLRERGLVDNVFCPTGLGGGIDPTCSPTDIDEGRKLLEFHSSASGPELDKQLKAAWDDPKSKAGKGLRNWSRKILDKLNTERTPGDALPDSLRSAILKRSGNWKGNFYENSHVASSAERYIQLLEAQAIGEPIFFRKGGFDKDVVSTTTDIRGAKSGSRITPDRFRTLTEMLQDGYHPVTGAGYYPTNVSMQEKEHIWIRGTPLTTNTRWKFYSSPDKLKAFQQWLRYLNYQWLKGTYGNDKSVWPKKPMEQLWVDYINRGFAKGAGRAFDDVRAAHKGLEKSLDFYNGTRAEFLRSSFAAPEALDKVKLLASRSFDELEGVTKDISLRLSRKLTDGLVQGKGPQQIAREVVKELDIPQARALTISRTELIRAHAEGQLIAFKKLGVEELGVAIEWSTARDNKVCPLCRPLSGIVVKTSEASGMIPRHPNCRCAWIPAVMAVAGQKRTKAAILAAIEKSAKLGGKKDLFGQDVSLSKDRPELINVNIANLLSSIPKNAITVFDRYLLNSTATKPNCGTGAGGFKEGNTCWQNKESWKAKALKIKDLMVEDQPDKTYPYQGFNPLLSQTKLSKEELTQVLEEMKSEGLARLYKADDGKIMGVSLTPYAKDFDYEDDIPTAEPISEEDLDFIELPMFSLIPDDVPIAQLADELPKAEDVEDVDIGQLEDYVPDKKNLSFVKTLPGSTSPSLMKDNEGNLWVLKEAKTASKAYHIRNETDTDSVYQALGIPTPFSELVDGPNPYKLAKYIDGGQTLSAWEKGKSAFEIEQMHKEISKNFVVDALLANWDVVGLSKDNLLIKDGVPYRIDNGGGLLYRAQGQPKGAAFGEEVTELKSMLDPSKNPSTAEVFSKHISPAEIESQIQALLPKTMAILKAIKDPNAQMTIGARLSYLAKLVPPQPLSSYKPEEVKKPKVDPSLFPAKPSFVSKNAANVEANNKAVDELLAMATTGNLEGLKALHEGHPSPKVEGFKQALVKSVERQLNGGKSKPSFTVKPASKGDEGAQPLASYSEESTNPLHKPKGVIDYLQGADPVLKMTPAFQAKVTAMNPKGLAPGVYKTPWVTKEQLVALKKLLPPGVKIKQGTFDPATNNLKGYHQQTTDEAVFTTIDALKKPTAASVVKGIPDDIKPLIVPIIDGTTVEFPSGKFANAAQQSAWKKTLTPEEKSAIASWKGSAATIRKSVTSGNLSATAKAFMSALEKSPPHTGLVYRGVSGSAYVKQLFESISSAGVGGYWSDSAPHCMTPNPGKAAGFAYGDLVFRIVTKTGRPIHKEDGFSNDGPHSEAEITGMPNTNYRITGIHKNVTLVQKGISSKNVLKYMIDLVEE